MTQRFTDTYLLLAIHDESAIGNTGIVTKVRLQPENNWVIFVIVWIRDFSLLKGGMENLKCSTHEGTGTVQTSKLRKRILEFFPAGPSYI